MAQQRGRSFELRVEKVLDQLYKFNQSVLPIRIEVRQARLKNKFVYCKKQPFDYLIVFPLGQQSWAFDAKETKLTTWKPLSIFKKCPHQIAALKRMQCMGHRAGFLVHFCKSDKIRFIEDLFSKATDESGFEFDWSMFFKNYKGAINK